MEERVECASVYVDVFACVCVWKSEREKEKERMKVMNVLHS